ncbi:UDP-glucose--hexose-1-phosphate uridylyltransferase [Paenibacillus sacheonensis]|uniref:Galactose-1-phosphate uridylyltransferase n=1 Tax=Paenibacillus sacheonensis TaxID=742054 RepID=A0A7X4YNZ1_9BACL|nr:UDP-glucose--hexose-1-phosphate uridylyltransferase [Paenibacillus sacheonensis]MBM7567356.1 UDPglucose--hexose-1-phosphate uridylyltransferase [Paenibacillus sacheonensis]NBC69862.1 UDP-glucose--hexose-1-phosphate uridylyltransferase [Paenibacillus sacheonensis]
MTEQQTIPGTNDVLLLIERLVQFAAQRGMIEPPLDVYYSRNALIDLFGMTEAYAGEVPEERLESPVSLLEPLLDYGASIGLIPDNTTTYRDLLDARIMGMLMPRPAEAAANFRRTAEREGIMKATDDFYRLSIDSNYIRMDRIAKNQYWEQPTEYGPLEITVNLSKPEKDPKEIALLKTMAPSNYPKCLLCADNVGYAGRADHPGRQNLRVVPLTLLGEAWYFQYSPYVYYNEHSIVFHGKHVPMRITHDTFARLLDFVDAFPHYFIGSNADLPIVGGSILNHDHFQAGRHVFPMETAAAEKSFVQASDSGLTFSIVAWPMSVVRVNGNDKAKVLKAAGEILDAWRAYSDPAAGIFAFTDKDRERVPHNTITPIARLRDNGEYELDLVLRNNRTSEEHPDGIFHPHAHLHHIKKENIGLIEVMGLAVLPGRLKTELEEIAALLTGETAVDAASLRGGSLGKHAGWIESMIAEHGTRLSAEQAQALLQGEVGSKFLDVLKDAGVYKRTEEGQAAFARFLTSLGLDEK